MRGKITKLLPSGFSQFWDIVVILALAAIWAIPEPTLRTLLGLLFFFLPGYGLTRFLFRYEKRDVTDFIIYTTIISFAAIPLLGNLVQVFVRLSSSTLMLTTLVFSIPLLVLSDMKSVRGEEIKTEVKDENNTFFKAMAFLGALGIGLGLYIQASLGTVAPRGWDIFDHMYTVNRIISTGEAVIIPSLNTLSNFHHFLYAGLSLLTGLDAPLTGVLGQTMLAAVFMMSIFYFAHSITGSPTASLISAVLFIAGPPLYSNMTAYFWYFHPMYVATAILPFALACFHEAVSGKRKRELGLSSLLITAVALYHLTVGLTLFFIIIFDFLFLLIKLRRKVLILDFSKICIVAFALSSILTIPFLLNITNPFRYIYLQGGLQTLYTMFFGISGSSVSLGPSLFSRLVSEFSGLILPPLLIGLPGLLYLSIKKSSSFILIFSCLLIVLLGTFQPVFGLAFMPTRFLGVTILFVSVLAGATLASLKFYFEALVVFLRRREIIKTKFKMPKMPTIGLQKGLILMLAVCLYILFFSFIVFYSPAKDAVLNGELEVREKDMIAIKEIDKMLPRDSKVLMDHYLQFFFTGITGRDPLHSISPNMPFYLQWSVYPLNVYLNKTDPSSVDVDYIVISPWCGTAIGFVGKEYFDTQENLTLIYEYAVERGPQAAYTGSYAVYKVIK